MSVRTNPMMMCVCCGIQEGQASCRTCPVAATATSDHTSCECLSTYYAIPFEDILIFEEVDKDGYETYHAKYIEAVPAPSFDPNEQVGFFCAACPEGANCIVQGTTIHNVSALDDYFLGVDGTGTTFFPCFNDACSMGGNCSDGYTGLACTQCETGLILNDKFECETCPKVLLMVIMVTGGLGLFFGYLVFSIRNSIYIYIYIYDPLQAVFIPQSLVYLILYIIIISRGIASLCIRVYYVYVYSVGCVRSAYG